MVGKTWQAVEGQCRKVAYHTKSTQEAEKENRKQG